MPPPISGNRPAPVIPQTTTAPAAPRPVAAPPTPVRALADSFTPSARIKTNNGNIGVDTARGTIPAAAWKSPEKVLGQLTQNPSGTVIGNMRCGPAGLLGGAVMQGQASTSALLTRVAEDPRYKTLSPEDRTELKAISAGVTNGTATFEQMNRAQDLLYKAGNTDGVDGFTPREMIDLAADKQTDTMLMPKTPAGEPDLGAVLSQLKPGDTAMVVVEGNMNNTDTPHYLTLGKKPDGTPFLYNPDPDVTSPNAKVHDRTLITGEAAVRSGLTAYNPRVVTDRPELMDVVVVHPK